MTHVIAPGDTLWALARRYGVTVAQLQAWNPGIDPAALRIGDTLNIDEPLPTTGTPNRTRWSTPTLR